MISTLDLTDPDAQMACRAALKYSQQCCKKDLIDDPSVSLMKCKDSDLESICMDGAIDPVNAETECDPSGCTFRTCCKPGPGTQPPTEEPTLEPEVAKCNLCPSGTTMLADKAVSPPFQGVMLGISF